MAEATPQVGSGTPQGGSAATDKTATGTTEPPAPAEVSAPTERVTRDEYKTQGKTLVSTPAGYAFEGTDLSIPTVTVDGLLVNKEQATALVAESDGLVTINDEKED